MRPWLTAALRRLLERMEGDGGQPAAALAVEVAPPQEPEVPLPAPPVDEAPASDDTLLLQVPALEESETTPPVPEAAAPLAAETEEPVEEALPMVDAPPAVMEEERFVTPSAPTRPPRPSPTYFTAIRMPDEYARRMLSPQFRQGTEFRRIAQAIGNAPLPPSGPPRIEVPGAFQRGNASPPPASRALQNWPAPTSTYNTFP